MSSAAFRNVSTNRRGAIETIGDISIAATACTISNPSCASGVEAPRLRVVTDPNTYSALYYAPTKLDKDHPPPLLVVLHGAGTNNQQILEDLANPKGEHAGLVPSLIADGSAPASLLENFAILAPYSAGKPSFYGDSRSKLLGFIDWAKQQQNSSTSEFFFDPKRIFLLGFSDGATVAVELLTTRRFAGGVVCSYGFTGKLPQPAIDRIKDIPFWVFHSKDDVIFDVGNSDRLVASLSGKPVASFANTEAPIEVSKLVRYSRYESDPEHLPSRVRGHSMGITASKLPQLYEWLLQLPPIA